MDSMPGPLVAVTLEQAIGAEPAQAVVNNFFFGPASFRTCLRIMIRTRLRLDPGSRSKKAIGTGIVSKSTEREKL